MKWTYCFLMIFLLIINACGTTTARFSDKAYIASQPDWVRQDLRRYPKHTYIAGMGVSNDAMAAQQMAQDEVLKQFKIEVEQYKQRLSPQYNAVRSAMYETIEFSALVLEYTQVVETWIDTRSGDHHVLAVLDRVTTSEELVGQIYGLDQKVLDFREKAQSEMDSLQKVTIARLSNAAQQQRQNLHTLLKTINPTSVVLPAPWENTEVEIQIDTTVAQTNILPIADGENLQYLQAIREGIRAAGFNVDAQKMPDYILKAHFEQSQVVWQDGMFVLNGSLHLELLEGKSPEHRRGEVLWPIGVRALDRENLQQVLGQAIKTVNEEKFRATFLQFETQ